jgi:stage III sporulation protein AG
MKEKTEGLFAKLRDSKNASRLIIVLGIGGMLLILLSEFLPSGAAQSKKAAASQMTACEYEAELETRLETILSKVDGAGKTEVMVTLETGEQSVYAIDTQEGEADTQQTHVLLDNGSALTETVRMPAVCGVAVVCEGGDQVHVVAKITEMLSSLLDLSTSRISVAKMN